MSEEAIYGTGALNSRSGRRSFSSPASNPPDELRDIYRQIDDEDSLTDLEGPEDAQFPMDDSLEHRVRPLSSVSGLGENEAGHRDVFSGIDANLIDDFTDSSLRRKLTDHSRDEQRLKRATSSRSPIFSRARVGKDFPASEDLQRRDGEVQQLSDDDGNVGPALNLPSSWGSRATRSRDWMRNIRNGDEPREEKNESTGALSSRSKTLMDSSVRPARASGRSPGRSSYGNKNTLGERTYKSRPRTRSPAQKSQRSTEDERPNTPTVGYRTSAFSKSSPTKRDSQQLLRKLSKSQDLSQDRNQEPPGAKTPERQKPAQSRIYEKTPVVTGAWIDTPVTERSAQPSEHLSNGVDSAATKYTEPAKRAEPEEAPQQDKPSQQEKFHADQKARRPLIKPNLPKSGLETVIEDVKADKGSYALGDDTIESLQEILNEQPTEPKAEEEENGEFEKAILDKLESAKPEERDATDFGGLNEKLNSLVQNIGEVKKGLNSLEDHLSRDSHVSSRPLPPNGGRKARHIHTGENCETCGAYSDDRLFVAIPFPRLWKRDPVARRIRPTRLGWGILISTIWFLIESTMCDYYCHPFVSNVCQGNCLMYSAPRFPFVLPTMLWRWSNLSAILTPLFTVFVAFFRLIAQLLGLWDGYVDDVPRAFNLSGEIRIRGSRVSDFPALTTAPSHNFIPKNLWRGSAQTHRQPPSAAGREVPSVPNLNLNLGDDASMDEDEYVA